MVVDTISPIQSKGREWPGFSHAVELITLFDNSGSDRINMALSGWRGTGYFFRGSRFSSQYPHDC